MAPPAEGGPPPWIDPGLQHQITWRDKDIVISVPLKSGTTWTMNIVHQLLHGGDPDFDDIYAEVPWIEFRTHPDMPAQELLDRVDNMSHARPRAFKTHSAPPALPYLAPHGDTDVRYVVVFRNPEEALVSAKPFLEKHTNEWHELWGVPKAAVTRPDFTTFYREVIDAKGWQHLLFGFLESWWPLRHNDNVLFLHFADMKRDHDGFIRKLSDFIGTQPTDEEWAAITEYTSFPWMKRHTVKFESSTIGAVPVLQPGAMVRKGKLGTAHEDGMTAEISQHLRSAGRQICPDEGAVRWFYEGGPLPT